MDDVREKLYKLIDDFDVMSAPIDGFRRYLVDYLIANGVTFAADISVGDKATPTADSLSANGATGQRWIPVTERLPEEHKSIFAGCYGTNNWMTGMFRTVSHTVIAAVLYEDGKRFVKAMHTQDGKWHHPGMVGVKEVTHWMPLPEPPKEG